MSYFQDSGHDVIAVASGGWMLLHMQAAIALGRLALALAIQFMIHSTFVFVV